MKPARIAALALAGLLLVAGSSSSARANVSFDFFYSNLSSHGSWMVSGSYGNVWQPRIYNADWNPYYDGHWEYTDCGWTWVSDYDWGGIPYHYGTWVRDARFGWVWVPGYVWGPSWVVFRSDADYIGWAPVPPEFTIGASFSSFNIDSSFYVFVPSRSFVSERVRTVIVPRTQVNVIVNKTKIINNNITIQNNVVVNNGPDVRMVEQRSGRRIERVSIERVRNAAPTGTVTRDEIRVDPARVRGHKVAEPARESLDEARAKEGRADNGRGRGNQQPEAAAPQEQTQQRGQGRGRNNQSETAVPQDQTQQRGQGRKREPEGAPQATPPSPNAPSAQPPSDAANTKGRHEKNQPTDASTQPRTRPRHNPQPVPGEASERRNPAAPEPREPRTRERPVPPPEPSPRNPGMKPDTPQPPNPQVPGVKPNEPPIDPNTGARKPVRTAPREKGKQPVTKDKKKPKPDESGSEK